MELITSGSFSSAATKDFTGLSAYRYVKLVIKGARPATDAVTPRLQFSTENGSTWTAAALDGGLLAATNTAVVSGDGDPLTGSTLNLTSVTQGNAASENLISVIEIDAFNQTSFKSIRIFTNSDNTSTAKQLYLAIVADESGVDFDSIRFSYNSGNISANGTYELWGVQG
jgi:hypothetical protein